MPKRLLDAMLLTCLPLAFDMNLKFSTQSTFLYFASNSAITLAYSVAKDLKPPGTTAITKSSEDRTPSLSRMENSSWSL